MTILLQIHIQRLLFIIHRSVVFVMQFWHSVSKQIKIRAQRCLRLLLLMLRRWMALLTPFSHVNVIGLSLNPTECNSYLQVGGHRRLISRLIDYNGSVKRQRRRFILPDYYVDCGLACGWQARGRLFERISIAQVQWICINLMWGTHSKGEGHFANYNSGCDPFRS